MTDLSFLINQRLQLEGRYMQQEPDFLAHVVEIADELRQSGGFSLTVPDALPPAVESNPSVIQAESIPVL